MRKIIFVIFIVSLGALFSCKRTLPDNGGTAVQKMSNGWWVNWTVGGVQQNAKTVFFETYNVNANTPDSMFIDDLENFWQFKGEVGVNLQAMTFSSTLSENNYYTSEAKVSNGKVLPLRGHSKSGVLTDSLYFEIQFSDDVPSYGNTYIVTGTARTGLIEDDY
jgi:hypothetical protein